MTDRYDAIVVGAGHNGLVCSALLAKAGKNVLVLEANEQVGGAAVTREFAEGYSVSGCAHLLDQLQPEVRQELSLALELSSENMTTIALAADGEHLRIDGDSVEGASGQDAENYRRFRKRMTRFSDLLRKYLNKPPPPNRDPTTVRSLSTKSSLNPDWATLPKLSEPKLLPKVALKMLLSESLSKLPPKF